MLNASCTHLPRFTKVQRLGHGLCAMGEIRVFVPEYGEIVLLTWHRQQRSTASRDGAGRSAMCNERCRWCNAIMEIYYKHE